MALQVGPLLGLTRPYLGLIVLLMDPRIPESLQREWAERDARNAQLADQFRREVGMALEQLGSALVSPMCSRSSMEEACKYVAKALSISAALDPEDR